VTYDGFCVDLAKQIADFVGFDYDIRPVKDGFYGAKEQNGTWNGMVGELVRHVCHSNTVTHQLGLLFDIHYNVYVYCRL